MAYRRIEVNAYRRRVTIVSGEWRPSDAVDGPAPAHDGVLLNDANSCEPVSHDSPEGQLLLVEAVRSLEHRLSPETRAAMCAATTAPHYSGRNRFYLKLQSLYRLICPKLRTSLEKER